MPYNRCRHGALFKKTCSWSHGLQPNKLLVGVAVPPAPVWVPSQRLLASNVASVANDKGDNKMILRAVHRFPGICLAAEVNL